MRYFSVAVLLLILGMGALRAEPGVTDDTILIGQSAVLSGPFAENGVNYSRGMRLYLEQVNAKGGVHGRKVELFSMDDAYDPKRAEENTHKLIESKQVFALFGYTGTGASLAALPVAEKAAVPFIAPYSGADPLRVRSSPVLFVLRAGYADEMRKIVEHQVTVGIKNIAVVYQNDGFGKAGLKSFEEAMAKYDLKPAATAAIDPVNLDAKPAVAILNKAAPAAVILATAGQGSSAIVREYLKTGSRPQFFGLSVVSAGQLRNELGKDVSGLVIAQVVPSPWSSKYPVVRQYRDALASRGEEPNYAALEGYVAAKVLVEGLRRSGKALTRGKLVSSLEEMKNWDAGGWSVDFGPGKRNASSFVDLSILRGDGTFLQ